MRTKAKKKLLLVTAAFFTGFLVVTIKLSYVMIAQADKYLSLARNLHQRDREIKAPRGSIYDRNGVKIASNKAVYSISVIYSQVTDREKVIKVLSENLKIKESLIRKKVYKNSVREKIKSNVEKDIADRIRKFKLDGVKVDEDYKRVYPYNNLASKVLGFTGGDNQGIIGLEVFYDRYLKGKSGRIRTLTDGSGIEIDGAYEEREEPVAGGDLYISLDVNLQNYAVQACKKVKKEKKAKQVSMILMNPQNGEIYADVNVPEFNLNEPFMLGEAEENLNQKEKQDALNRMWRNLTVNDTYEPGSTFKIITMAAGLSEGVVTPNDRFSCPGFKVVEDRRIHCHKRSGHGAEDFVQGAMNSCNPVFIEVGLRLGVERYYHYFKQFGLLKKTGIDIPGEAGTIMHKEANIGQVELATISFGQSFQITPIQLVTTVSSIINGGRRITPHFGVYVTDETGKEVKRFEYPVENNIVTEEVSKEVREILEKVVSEGSGKNAFIEGHTIGGKTATSQTLPRSENRYISSFLGFAPANHPKILGLVLIDEPQGTYYGGVIAAPVMAEIFQNVLPYLDNL